MLHAPNGRIDRSLRRKAFGEAKVHYGTDTRRLAPTAAALIGVLGIFVPLQSAMSQSAPGAPSSAGAAEQQRTFNIPAGDLTAALRAFAEVSGLQLVYSTDLTAKARTGGISGSMSESAALAGLLEGTGLTYRYAGERTVTIEKGRANGARTLGPVRVEGASTQLTAGINGSTDPTATEGTHSYTSSALSVASKTPLSIQETPQSVSVITQQQMQDQNITDFNSLMNQATGVTAVTTNNPLMPTFYSRGFAIQRLQVDGGAPMDISGNTNRYGLVPLIDMAEYDHAELLRGADGLFDGYGAPGGVISLTRKQPLDHSQVVVEGQYGSWDNYRTTVDATAPLGLDGRLRGRAVMAYQDQDYFYDTASSNKTLAYGVLEDDLTPTTTLGGGFSFTRQDTVPWYSGLPRYENGDDLQLPRSTCLCFDWGRYNFDTKEYFARLEQALGKDWSVKLNLTRTNQDSSYKYGYVYGTVNPTTDAGPTMNSVMGQGDTKQTAVDFTVNGDFDLFGHRQILVVGGNYSKLDGSGGKAYPALMAAGAVPFPPVNVLHFNPDDAAYIEGPSRPPSNQYPQNGTQQWGSYVSLRLTFWEPLHLNIGTRYSHYELANVIQALCINVTSAACSGRAIGDVSRTTSTRYSTHDVGWPPNYSLVYDISPTLSAYGSYTDIYQEQSTFIDRAGNPIAPITGSNFEGGLKWAGRGGRLNATLSVYRLRQKNFASFPGDYSNPADYYSPDGIHQCCYNNNSDLTYLSEGVDLEVTGELLPGWQLSSGYTFNQNEYNGTDWYGPDYTGVKQPLVTQAPKQLLKLWSTYQFHTGEWLRKLSVGGGVNAQTRSYTAGSACVKFVTNPDTGTNQCDTTPDSNVDYQFTQGFYAVFSARLSYQLDSHWNAALNVNNLTDRTYYQTAGSSTGGNWYGEPRSFMLAVRGSF